MTYTVSLLQDLLVAHEEEDTDKFADIVSNHSYTPSLPPQTQTQLARSTDSSLLFLQVKDYDAISRIDQWLTAQLLHIKKSIHAIPDIN